MSDTPETDAHQERDGMAFDWLWSDFARRLEREKNALRAQVAGLRSALECLREEFAHKRMGFDDGDITVWDFASNALNSTAETV